ncbi:MAG: ABC transporter substrate-binding protein [Thermoleophilia bacterium]|nr:ABC transporter substrate-binding protein [Thermoleophilia bacterium]
MKRRFLLGGLLIVVLLVGMLAVACGEDEETTTTAAPATTAPASSDTTAAPASSDTTAAPASSDTTAPASKEETLTLGVITSVTGVMAPGFKAIYDSVGPVKELLNSKGGVTVGDTHYTIDIVAYDDQSTTDGAMTAINKIIQDGVMYLYAPMFMPNNLAIAQLCEENKIIRMKSFGAGAIEVNPDNPYMFFTNAGVENIEPFYDYAAGKYPDVKKVAIVAPDDPGGSTYVELVKAAIASHGLEEVYFELYPIGTEDYYPILNKALAAKPDAIDVIYGIPPWTSAVINQSRELGFTGPIYAPCTAGDSNILKAMVKPEYLTNILSAAPDVYSDKMLPIVKELRALVEEQGTSWEMDSLHLLDVFTILIQAMEGAGSIDTEQIVAYIDGGKMTSFDTIYGPGEWGSHPEVYGNNHCGKKPLLMSIFMDGNLVFEFVQ